MTEPNQSRPNRRRRWRRIFVVLALFLIFAGAGVWILAKTYGSEFARQQLETVLSDVLETRVRVKELIVRPALGEFGIEGLTIAQTPTSTANMVQLVRALVRVRVPRLWPPDIVFSIEVDDLELALDEEPVAEPQATEPLQIALPSRFEFGPLTLRVESAQLNRGRFVYLDRAAGLEIRLRGISAHLTPEDKGFAASVTAESFVFRLPEVAESAERLNLEGAFDPERIVARRLTFIRDGQAFEVSGTVLQPFNELALDLTARGKIPLQGLDRYVKSEAWPLSGLLELDGAIRGPIPSLHANWTVGVPTLTAGPLRAGEVHVQGEWDSQVLRISDLRAGVFGGSVQGKFEMVPERLSETHAKLSLTHASLQTLDALQATPLGLQGTVNLEANVSGDPEQWRELKAQLEVRGQDIVLPGDAAALGPGRLDVSASLEKGAAAVSNVKAHWRAAEVSASGKVDLNGPFDVRADLSGNMMAIARAFHWKGFDGKATFAARSKGDWQRLVAKGNIQGSLVSVAGSEIGRLEVPFRVQEETLQVESALVRLGQTRLESSMTANWGENSRFKGKLRAVPVRMEDLAIFMPADLQVRGGFNLTAQAAGTPAVWRGSGTADAQELSVADLFVEHLTSNFSGNEKGVTVTQLGLSVNGVPIKAQGDWGWNRLGSAKLEIQPTELASIRGIPQDARLQGTVQASIQGSVKGNTIAATGQIALKKVALQELSLGDGELTFTVKDSSLSSNLSFPGLKLSGNASGKLATGGNIDAELVLQEFSLEPVLTAFAPDLSEELSGQITGVAKVRLPYDDPLKASGSVRFDPVRLSVAGEKVHNEGPIAFEMAEETFRLQNLTLKSAGGGRLAAYGTLTRFEAVDLKAEGNLPLTLLSALSPAITEADGTLRVDVKVSGSMGAPVITGGGKVIDGSVAFADYPDALRQIEAEFAFTPKGGRLKQLTALLGSGSIKGSGQIELEGFNLGSYQAKLTLRDLPVAPVDGLRTAWNVDLELLGFEKRGILQGEANLLRGDYSRDLSILSLIFDKRAGISGGGSSEPAPLDLVLKVRVNLNDNFRVRTPLARLRVGGSLNVEGPVSRPVVFGAIEVRDGYITFQKRRFELSRATVSFVDPRQIDPVLDIEATAKLKQYDVTLRLEGRPQDLTINLSSDPSLPEEDLLSLVAFGVTREQFGKSAPGVLAGQAAQLIADDLFGSGGVLDNIDVDTQGEDGSTVTVTARIDEDTTVSFANGKNGQRKVRVEHQLLGPLLIAGGQSEGGFETDVVLRFRFR